MSDLLVLAGIALVGASGLPGLFLAREGRAGERLAAITLTTGAGLGIAGAVWALLEGGSAGVTAAWSVPGGAFEVQVDALSALFVIQVLLIGAAGAIYGLGYWPQAEHRDGGRKLRAFYGLLLAAMSFLSVARQAVLFLFGWEVMALAAFLVLTTDDKDAVVRKVGYVYLACTRVGTLCLFAAFGTLFLLTGSFRFAPIAPGIAASSAGTALFVVALVGFGMKAGLMPLHLWLPGAHANAPSHVSAVMSGVLLKTGLYGLFRLTSLFSDPPLWWGIAILAAGAVSAVLGVAFALGQHDLKRLLAYHSVENVGIICLGLGLALVGRSLGRPELIVLGVAGGSLHILNHGLFKALLFLSAGAVVHATGTREIDRLGGLLRPMRWTGLLFLTGAVAICGLPPLNGFVSELFVYLGLGHALSLPGPHWLGAALLMSALALVGGLALACFAKVFGAVFLGAPRTDATAHAHEAGWAMRGPMLVLAAACVTIGVAPVLIAPSLTAAARAWAPELTLPTLETLAPLRPISLAAAALLGMVAVIGGLFALSSRRAPATLPTWDCGYAEPSARMQYTASSFAQLLVGLFSFALRPSRHAPALATIFPRDARFESHVAEVVLDLAVEPAVNLSARAFSWAHWLQRGSVQTYLLYVLFTLLALLAFAG